MIKGFGSGLGALLIAFVLGEAAWAPAAVLLALPLGAALSAAFACSFVPHPWAAYGLMGLLMAAVSVYCLRGLRQRMRQS